MDRMTRRSVLPDLVFAKPSTTVTLRKAATAPIARVPSRSVRASVR